MDWKIGVICLIVFLPTLLAIFAFRKEISWETVREPAFYTVFHSFGSLIPLLFSLLYLLFSKNLDLNKALEQVISHGEIYIIGFGFFISVVYTLYLVKKELGLRGIQSLYFFGSLVVLLVGFVFYFFIAAEMVSNSEHKKNLILWGSLGYFILSFQMLIIAQYCHGQTIAPDVSRDRQLDETRLGQTAREAREGT